MTADRKPDATDATKDPKAAQIPDLPATDKAAGQVKGGFGPIDGKTATKPFGPIDG